VSLYFPRDRSDAPLDRQGFSRSARTTPRGSERILLVEDDSRLRERTANALVRLGYRVSAATDGENALAMLETEGPFDLLFTDVVMPGAMNGVELAQQAMRRSPALKLMFMTGYAGRTETLTDFLRAGAKILHKPFTTEELAGTVREALTR
jgi:CheY-like chemotaxis protein